LRQEDADRLARMNDDKKPFTEIADAIDALPPFFSYENPDKEYELS
jgi:hypothetical protein